MIKQSFLSFSFSSPATEQGKTFPKELKMQKKPSEQASSPHSYHSSSGNRLNANTTLINPSIRIITSVISEICPEILSKKAPTIKPTPKFRIVSAKNFLFIQANSIKEV